MNSDNPPSYLCLSCIQKHFIYWTRHIRHSGLPVKTHKQIPILTVKCAIVVVCFSLIEHAHQLNCHWQNWWTRFSIGFKIWIQAVLRFQCNLPIGQLSNRFKVRDEWNTFLHLFMIMLDFYFNNIHCLLAMHCISNASSFLFLLYLN